MGPSKKVGRIREILVLDMGYLAPRETFAPQLQTVPKVFLNIFKISKWQKSEKKLRLWGRWVLVSESPPIEFLRALSDYLELGALPVVWDFPGSPVTWPKEGCCYRPLSVDGSR